MGRRTGNLLLLAGAVAVVLVAWLLLRDEAAAEAPPQRPPYVLPVTLATVERGDLVPIASLAGEVRALDRAWLSFETEGVVSELTVREGDSVKRGQVLGRIEPSELELRVASADADLALAERELEKLRAGERAEDRRRLQAELEAARAEAQLAGNDVARGEKLLVDRVISEREQDARTAARDAALARANAASERVDAALAGTRVEDIAIQEARVAQARAALDLSRRQLEKTVLRAPWEGAVVQRAASPGDRVGAGDGVLEVVDLSRVEVVIEVPDRYAAEVSERSLVRIARPGREPVEASVSVLIPVADRTSRNFTAIARLAAGDAPGLRAGLFVRAELELEPARGALLVPSDAVRITEQGPIVVRADDPVGDGPPTAALVPVRVVATRGARSAVEPLGGATLAAGDRIVLTGVDLAFPGAPLLPRTTEPEPSVPAGAPESKPASKPESGAESGAETEGSAAEPRASDEAQGG